jgi:nodulation protein E
MNPIRVVVTGLGTISSLGANHHEFWNALTQAKSGILPIKQVDCSALRFNSGAEVNHFNADTYFQPKELSWLDRFAQFALIAAQEAIEDAQIEKQALANAHTAVITGSCLGGKNTEEEAYSRIFRHNKPRTNPNSIPNAMSNAGASHISTKFQITGPAYTISTACASSTHAIGHAFWLIRQGIVSRAIAGGSETPFTEVHLHSWDGLRVISPDTCRPFSHNRSGMSLGEGGAMLFLESLESAKPNSSGQTQAILSALQDAKITPESIHYINAHGTGTLINDEVESQTIRTVFPDAKHHLLVSSTKGAHGHLLGAAGAIETIATVLAIQHKLIPPTINFTEKSPECDVPLVTNQAAPHTINHALCSSFAFGGLNAVLALGRFEE